MQSTPDEQRRLLTAFVRAITDGEQDALFELLAEDVVMIGDGGPHGARHGQIREVGRPVVGRTKVAALVRALARQGVQGAQLHERVLNGEPAIVAFRDGQAVLAVLVSVADGKIRHLFLQADVERLKHVGPLP